ncbi:MAG: magnesium protoporphyrin IX methyltransferase, partial [Bradyrhizobium sp.]
MWGYARTTAEYLARRSEVETYFDRTAVAAWTRLTSDAPVGRIRATVRAGRDEMRRTLLSWLPLDLRGADAADRRVGGQPRPGGDRGAVEIGLH